MAEFLSATGCVIFALDRRLQAAQLQTESLLDLHGGRLKFPLCISDELTLSSARSSNPT
jgi:hypothetical protein